MDLNGDMVQRLATMKHFDDLEAHGMNVLSKEECGCCFSAATPALPARNDGKQYSTERGLATQGVEVVVDMV